MPRKIDGWETYKIEKIDYKDTIFNLFRFVTISSLIVASLGLIRFGFSPMFIMAPSMLMNYYSVFQSKYYGVSNFRFGFGLLGVTLIMGVFIYILQSLLCPLLLPLNPILPEFIDGQFIDEFSCHPIALRKTAQKSAEYFGAISAVVFIWRIHYKWHNLNKMSNAEQTAFFAMLDESFEFELEIDKKNLVKFYWFIGLIIFVVLVNTLLRQFFP